LRKTIIVYLLAVFVVSILNEGGLATQSPEEKNIISILSEIRYSESLVNSIHENNNVLKSIGLFLQMIDSKSISDEEMARFFVNLLVKAGWKRWIPVISMKRLRSKLYLVGIGAAASTQPSSLYIFYDSNYKRITKDDYGLIYVTDFRLVNDELGVIFNRTPGSTHPLLDFALLHRYDGEWKIVWTPGEQKQWIAIDGEIRFLKNDLSLIQVKGSSLTIESSEYPEKEEVFKGGPERYFIGIWEKNDDFYVRKTNLFPDASLYDKLWEMTVPSPYAIVFEFLRKLRNGKDEKAAELSSITIVNKTKEMGLAKTYDLKGDIIFYYWGSNVSEQGEENISMKYASKGEVFFFYRRKPLEQYVAILKSFKTQTNRTYWEIIDIEKMKDDN
jgi:hypothetical protein